jgi:hypothetical protein
MTTVILREPKTDGVAAEEKDTWSGEVVVLCPKCKALQTLQVAADAILPTRKYAQRGTHIYHDCGATEPCRLYRIL